MSSPGVQRHPEVLFNSCQCRDYNQRGPSEHTNSKSFRRLVLGFMNADFCDQGLILWIFRDLHQFLHSSSGFCDYFCTTFSQNSTQSWQISRSEIRSCKISFKLNLFCFRSFAEYLFTTSDFDRIDANIAVFEKI